MKCSWRPCGVLLGLLVCVANYLAILGISQRLSLYAPATLSQPGPSGTCEQTISPLSLLRHLCQRAGAASASRHARPSSRPMMAARVVFIYKAQLSLLPGQ